MKCDSCKVQLQWQVRYLSDMVLIFWSIAIRCACLSALSCVLVRLITHLEEKIVRGQIIISGLNGSLEISSEKWVLSEQKNHKLIKTTINAFLMTSVGARVTYSELLECLTYSLSVREVRGLPIGGCFSFCRESNITRRLIVLNRYRWRILWEKDGCFNRFSYNV